MTADGCGFKQLPIMSAPTFFLTFLFTLYRTPVRCSLHNSIGLSHHCMWTGIVYRLLTLIYIVSSTC